MSEIIRVGNRRELAAYFSTLNPGVLELQPAPLRDVVRRLAQFDAALEFDSDDSSIPKRVVVRAQDRDDFLAWCSTYVESLSPLTAFVEVWDADEALVERPEDHMAEREKAAVAGATLMDGLLQSRSKIRVSEAILPATLRTLSAVFAQAVATSSPESEISGAAKLWAAVRSALGAPEMPYKIDNVLSFWSAASPVINSRKGLDRGSDLTLAVKDVVESGGGDSKAWRRVQQLRDISVPNGEILSMSRQERLRFVDSIVRDLERNRMDAEIKAAFGGYLLSLVADGDFSMWPTAASEMTYPTAPLWFGFFTAAAAKSNVLSFNQSTGRRLATLLRYRTEDIDIDAREFLVSRRVSRGAALDFPLATFNVLKARLSPGVCGWFSVREVPTTSVPPAARDAAPQRSNVMPRQIAEARNLAERIVLLLAGFQASAAPTDPRQLELTPPPQSKASARRKRKAK